MGAGFRGTFVISWSQTEIDGLPAAPIDALRVGAAWSWTGQAVCVDGPADVLRLGLSDRDADLRQRAARAVRRRAGAGLRACRAPADLAGEVPAESGFTVTDGLRGYAAKLIGDGPGAGILLAFEDCLPPRGRDLWVVHHALRPAGAGPGDPASGGVICFTPGTRIDTPEGPRKVEQLREGDRVLTRDDGAQEILWVGARRMTGARLHVMPHLRPVRFRPGALGIERPDDTLLVSPEHRVVVRGAAARALFNTPEVLVPARALVNDRSVTIDRSLREVTYVHLLLARHQVLVANGVETESFHPASTALSSLGEADRARLLELMPGLARDAHLYGGYARRILSAPEAAILMHEAA